MVVVVFGPSLIEVALKVSRGRWDKTTPEFWKTVYMSSHIQIQRCGVRKRARPSPPSFSGSAEGCRNPWVFKVPRKIGVLICLPVTSRPRIFL